MVRLIDRKNRLYLLGTTYLDGSFCSWRVKYWISPNEDGSKWEIFRLGEPNDDRND